MKTNKYLLFFALCTCLLASAAVVQCFGQEKEAANEGADITVEDAVICRDVIDREPVGVGDVFSSDLTRLMCFTRITGSKGKTEVLHNWYFGEEMVASIPLHVGSSDWRTYSSKKIVPGYAGEWKVEILTKDKALLKRIYFIIE